MNELKKYFTQIEYLFFYWMILVISGFIVFLIFMGEGLISLFFSEYTRVIPLWLAVISGSLVIFHMYFVIREVFD